MKRRTRNSLSQKAAVFIAAILLAANTYQLDAASRVGILKHAAAIYAPRPDYPLGARSRYEEGSGWFIMRIQIKTGQVKEVYVVRSTGYSDLDDSTVRALKRWRFKPNALPSIKKINPHRNDPFATEDSLAKVPVSFEMQFRSF
jgi:TonB family protein